MPTRLSKDRRTLTAKVTHLSLWTDAVFWGLQDFLGALNIYSREPRQWSDEDIGVAVALADVATSYVANASKLHGQEQLGGRLLTAVRESTPAHLRALRD